MKNNFLISFFLIIITSILLNSCNTLKYVPKQKKLLDKNTIIVNGKTNKDTKITEFLAQKPNKKVALIPLSLYLYNLGNKDFFHTTYQKWKEKKAGTYKFLNSTFSEKQAFAYYNSKKTTNNWFFKTFEAPVILDSVKIKKTATNLENHFFNEGYFDAKITFFETGKKNRKGTVTYTITKGEPTLLDTITKQIASKVLDSLYETAKGKTLLKKRNQFNIQQFEDERDRLTVLFRNNGVYYFDKSAIDFEGDTLRANHLTNIKTQISNRVIEQGDSLVSIPFNIKKVKNVTIYTDYNYTNRNKKYLDTIHYKGFTFISHTKNKYKPKLLVNSLFIEPNTIYKDIDRELTRKHLRGLQNFRLVNIKYKELDENNLESSIYLTPHKKVSLKTDLEATHSNIKPFGISLKGSVLTRNTFRGGEILKFSGLLSFINSKDVSTNQSFFNAWEVGADLSVNFPRFLLPFSKKIIPKYMAPKTTISLGTSLQKNIGLDKQKFTGIINYRWQSSRTKRHTFELLNAQYIQNLNANTSYANAKSYFRVYASEYNKLNALTVPTDPSNTTFPNTRDANGNLENPLNYASYITDTSNGFQISDPIGFQIANNVINRRNIITENILVPALSYEFIYDTSTNLKDHNFSFFRGKITAAGNLTTLLSNQTGSDGNKQISGIDIAQFIRGDLEYKKFWSLNNYNVMAFRSFLGLAIPYGNSNVIPFSRSYFIGGPNDLRAWRIYDLGPGTIKSGLDYNVGNLKLITSLEYRFKIVNSINGALFMDAGNTWDLDNASFYDEGSKFTGFNSLKDIAIGTGLGIRYDFNFLVFRLDLGFKTYEPYLNSGNKWFQNYTFQHAVYNLGINYPF